MRKENQVGCNKCGAVASQIKQGFTSAGSQRVLCKLCMSKYTPIKKCYDDNTKLNGVKLYLSGMSARGVGKIIGVKGDTVMEWVKNFQSKSNQVQSQ